MKFLGRIILIGVPVALIVGIIVLVGTLQATAPQPERAEITPSPTAVFVTEAVNEPTRLTVVTQGEVTAMTEIDLVSQVSGRITYVNPNFVNGGFFQAGEVLVGLEDADYRLAVTRAEALVAQRRQQMIREEAEAELAAEEWEAIGEGEASALTLRQPQMAEAQAQLAGAQASLAEARLNLSRTRISAPFEGRIRSRSADLGQFVTPGARIARVFSTDRVEVHLPLTNAEIAALDMPLAFQESADNPGPRVELSTPVSGELRRWEGRVVRTDGVIDTQTRTVTAIIQVDDPYGAAAEASGVPLAVGLFVSAHVEGRLLDNAIVLPRAALRGGNEVYVAERNGTLSVRTVQVISSSPDRVVLARGSIEVGERVVTSPLRGAASGMLIRALDENGEPLDPDPASEDADEVEHEGEAAVAEQTAGSRAR